MADRRRRRAGALVALALALAVAAAPAAAGTAVRGGAARIGVEMPAAGDDGGAGLAVTTAIRLALGAARTVARDSADGGFANPHQDEGSDNLVDVRRAPAILARFAADPGIAAAIAGLRRNVGDADAAAADEHGLPTVVLARWSRGGRNAFCLCASPPRLAAFAAGAARARFGRRLLVVLAGDAGALATTWAGRFPGPVAAVAPTAASVAAARRAATAADAVLLLADERPALLWRAAAFAARFDLRYLRQLGERGFELRPAGARTGDLLAIGPALPHDADSAAFARRFHAAAGTQPDEAATRGYAAGELLRGAGRERAAIRRALATRRFGTVAGAVAFDADGYWRDVPLTATAL